MEDELEAAMAAGNGTTPDLVESRPAAITFMEHGGTREVTYIRRDLFDQLLNAFHVAIGDLSAMCGGMMPPATSDALRQVERNVADIKRSAK